MIARPDHYRELLEPRDLQAVVVSLAESNLRVAGTSIDAERVRSALADARSGVEACIRDFPSFLSSLQPIDLPPTMPAIARQMAHAGRCAGVGPMAAVAGAIAESVAWTLRRGSPELIVENGGDLFCIVRRPRIIGLAVGNGAFDAVLGLRLHPGLGPCGIASSSGTAGGSLSFGRADLVTIVARNGALADAVATAAGNLALHADAIGDCVDFAVSVDGVLGAIAVMGDSIALRGDLDVVSLH